MEIAALTATAAGFGYLGHKYLRKHWKVEVNCWFCNEDCLVEWQNNNSFTCPFCEQYNGFTTSGDYINTPEQFGNLYKRYCVPGSSVPDIVPSCNGLCNLCNTKQAIIVEKLANFEPINEDKFNEEYDTYKYKLDQMYPLCSECSIKTHEKFQSDKTKYSYLLDLKYKLFPIIKSSWDQAGNIAIKLAKRRRRHFFKGGKAAVFSHCISFFLSFFMFSVYFNFLQEDTNVVLVQLPTLVRQVLSHSTTYTLHLTAIILLAHLIAMRTNECRATFPDLLHPILLGLHFLSFPFQELARTEDLLLFRCGVSALIAVMAMIILIVPRKLLHKTKPNRVITSAFSVASTPVSQCSSQNVTIRSSLEKELSRHSPKISSYITKQSVRNRYQWREREQTPDIDPSPRRKKMLIKENSPEEMDWEPSPAPSVISLSAFSRRERERTPSRILASTLSSMTLGETKHRSHASVVSEFATPSLFEHGRMNNVAKLRSHNGMSSNSESGLTSVSQQAAAAPNHVNGFSVWFIFLFLSLITNIFLLYFMFYKQSQTISIE